MQARFSNKDVAVVGQFGGPTAVINRIVVSATKSLKEHGMPTILGAHFGLNGLLKSDFYNLGAQSERTLALVEGTPGSALGAGRREPTNEDCKELYLNFRKVGVTYLLYIGGDDSAKAALKIYNFFSQEGYPLKVFHLAKTVDNDLKLHYYTPGYGSAQLYIVHAIIGILYDDNSNPGVHIVVTMGNESGCLTAGSSLISLACGLGPNKIYLPEKRFDLDVFLGDVQNAASDSNRTSLFVVSEGIWSEKKWSDTKKREVNKPLLETIGAARGDNAFGGTTLGGTSKLGDFLADEVQRELKITKVRADTLGYPQRCFPSCISTTDADDAKRVGREAVIHALGGVDHGSVALKPFDQRQDGMATRIVALEEVGNGKRAFPPEFMTEDGNGVTTKFMEYALPIIGGRKALPKVGSLEPIFFELKKDASLPI